MSKPEKLMLDLTKKIFLDLIQLHVPLENHGDTSSGYCPFCYSHEETFLAYCNEQRWSCFSCQKKGNINDFIAQTENLSTQETERFIHDFVLLASSDENVKVEEVEKKVPSKLEVKGKNEVDSSESKQDISELDDNNTSVSEENNVASTADNYEPEIKISEPEIFTLDSKDMISHVDDLDILKKLLATYRDCPECCGIAILHNSDNNAIGSSIDELDIDDLQTLNLFINSSFKLACNILGDFNTHSSTLLFRMGITIKSAQKKLIWMRIQSKEEEYSLFTVLKDNITEKMFLIKLKNNLEKLDFNHSFH